MGRYLAIIWLAIATLIEPAGAADLLVINTYLPPPYHTKEENGFYDDVFHEIGRRIERDITIVGWPGKRGIRATNSGSDDGHFPRIIGAAKEFENLIHVPVPVFQSTYVAIAKRPDVEVTGWDSLKSYSVAYPLGWKVYEDKMAHFGTSFPVESRASLLRMVDRGRVDVALYEKSAFRLIAEKEGLTHLRVLHPPLSSEPLFLLLHKKHAALVPMFAAALTEITEDGTLRKLCPPCAEAILGPE